MKRTVFLLIVINSLSLWAACPDTSLNEGAEDCPWAQVARDIIKEPKKCDSIIKKEVPFFSAQVALDKKAQLPLKYWGLAKNFDENAKAIIVDNSIVQCLSKKMGLEKTIQQEPQYQVVHAGLQHTYSYLFSNTPTPYGYKRARWTNGDVQNGFEFGERKPLFPTTKSGAFLTNVTYFFAKFAFKDDAERIKKLEQAGLKAKSLAKELIQFDISKYEVKNLIETVKGTDYVIHTTFVKLNPAGLKSKNSHLLIYWVENTKTADKQFISGFPVEASFVTKALDEKGLGEDKTISLRYNAFVADLTHATTPLTGKREVK